MRPDTRTLLISGYTGDALNSHLKETGDDVHLLQKPFSGQQLLDEVRFVCDTPKERD